MYMLQTTMELRQPRWTCLFFVSALLAPLSHALLAAPALTPVVQPMACTSIQSAMGPSYRWPTPNPGMVAPLNVVWNYPVYRNPLRSSYTGKSIQIDIPPSFGEKAGFHLGTTPIPTATDERYRLTRVDIRKPAQAYSGLGQALTHVMEMVLIHRQENGDRWANVILPFQVSTDGADMDIINPIIDGTNLPSRIGATGIVMASAVSELMLAPGFDNASFSEFWGTAPVFGCPSKNVNVRYFMRTSTLFIGVDTFEQLSSALQNAPVQDPTQPPEATWTIGTCRNSTGTCVVQKAVDMQAKLVNMQKYQSQALTEQRTRKVDLDAALKALQAFKGPATNKSITAFDAAAAAFNNLKAAASELTSAESNTAQIQVFATEASSAKWDQDAPAAPSAATAPAAAAFADVATQEAVDTAPSVAESLLARFLPSRSSFRGKRRVSV